MKQQRGYVIFLFTIVCILINVAGKAFAGALELPVWLDSFGTVLASYAGGPFCGAVVGFAGNIIFNFSNPLYMVYALTSIMIGVVTGIIARKKTLETLFGIMTTGFMLALVSVVVSTPLNYIFFNGYTSNKWGNGIIDMLREHGLNNILCCIIGEYYVDFIDKVITLVALYVFIRIIRWVRDKKMINVSVLLLLCILSFSIFSGTSVRASGVTNSEYNNWLQTIYDAGNGLPGGSANDVAQTEDGVLWIGTYGGMYRYNGSEFQLMNRFESVKNVNCFYTDSEGRLWIGTNDNGLSICINNEIANVIDEDSGLPSNSVRCIKEGDDGNYYVGTTDSLAIVNLSSGLTVVDTIPEIKYAVCITTDENGCTVVVTDEGSLYLLEGTELLLKKDYDVQGECFTCAAFGNDGNLYLGTSGNHIVKCSVKDGAIKELKNSKCSVSHINSIRIYDEQIFVCGDNGVGCLDVYGRFRQINTGQFNSSIDKMIMDYQGNLWFVSSRLGLLKLCESSFMEIFDRLGFRENVVNAITRWNGKFYFGTDGGLNIADEKLNRMIFNSLATDLSDVRIRSLLVDSNNTLWISTSGSGVWNVAENGDVTVYDGSKGVLGDKFRSAIELNDKTIVLAGDSGLTFIKEGKVVSTIGSDDGLDNPKVLCLLEREDGSVLVGTDGNGIAVIKDGEVVKTLQKKDGLSSKVILRMVADGTDGIFIVTGNNLCYMGNNDEIRMLGNFPYYNNFDVINGTDGKLFVTCSAGVYVVDKASLLAGEAPEYQLLDYNMGLRISLTANSWNYVDDDNNIYLAGDTGVAVFNMKEYDMGRNSYRMNIKSMQVDDTVYHVRLDDTVNIPRGSTRIVISPEIINYSTSNPSVSYYLEGFDSAPKVFPLAELKEAVYTNLSSGTYIFHLAVLDKNGKVVSENKYQIVKEADIYDEKWFKIYAGFVFILTIVYLTWMLFRTQIQKTLNIQKRELEFARKQVEMSNEAILTIAKTVDAKDPNTSQHSLRVAKYAVLIGTRLGLSHDELAELRRASLLHDIGKIGIPDSVLNKPAKLTDEEYAIMKSHVTKGAEILEGFTSVEHIVEGALYHHERYDGKGYAQGLKGEDIPLYGRIIGVADAFDAMTANRVYRKKLDFNYVLGELRKGKGTQFDPKLVDIMLELIADGEIKTEELYVESQNEKAIEKELKVAIKKEEAKSEAEKNEDTKGDAIIALAKTLDEKDSNHRYHAVRVAQYSTMIGRKMGLSEDECAELKRVALLHDIGNISIPDSVLNKPSKLTDEEYTIMKSHVEKGVEIVKDFISDSQVAEAVQAHHERYDGHGYPDSLKGDEIPLHSRIISVVDAFDAMTSNRTYRKRMDANKVCEELKTGKGTQFDPEIVDVLLGLIEEGAIRIDDPQDEAEERGAVDETIV